METSGRGTQETENVENTVRVFVPGEMYFTFKAVAVL